MPFDGSPRGQAHQVAQPLATSPRLPSCLLPSSFTHRHGYYTHQKKAVCIHRAELWSGIKAVMQPHPHEAQALGNSLEKRNSSWHPRWIFDHCVAASGVKSLRRAQQPRALWQRVWLTEPLIWGDMCGRGVASQDLHRDMWENKWMTTDTWACALWSKKITFFIVVCSGNFYGAAGFYSTIKRNWRCVPMKMWDWFLVTSALNCLKLFQNELIWERRFKSIKLCCEHFTTWDFLKHCNCIFSFVPSNEKKSHVFLYLY